MFQYFVRHCKITLFAVLCCANTLFSQESVISAKDYTPQVKSDDIFREPTIPGKLVLADELNQWLSKLEASYNPPKWSAPVNLTEKQQSELNEQRAEGIKKAKQAQSVIEYEKHLHEVLKAETELFGPESETVLDTMERAAAYFRDHDGWEQCEKILLQIQAMNRHVYGENSYQTSDSLRGMEFVLTLKKLKPEELTELKVAGAMHNQAQAFMETKKYNEAKLACQHALKTREKLLGKESLRTVVATNLLAEIYRAQKDYTAAEPLYAQASKSLEKIVGVDHPQFAAVIENQAKLYSEMNIPDYALVLQQGAVAIKTKLLGAGHIQTIRSLQNLGGIYYSQHNYKLAQTCLHKAIRYQENIVGPAHLDLANPILLLAKCYLESVDDYAPADSLLRRALAIYNKELGPDNLQTARCMYHLAEVQRLAGDFEEAEKMHQQVLQLRRNKLGPKSTLTAQSEYSLGKVFKSLHNDDLAEALFVSAFMTYESHYGAEHPSALSCSVDLASIYIRKQDYEQAEKINLKCLEIHKKIFGPEHYQTADSYFQLGQVKYYSGDYRFADFYFQQALKIQKKVLGPNDIRVYKTINMLAYTEMAQHRADAALKYFAEEHQYALSSYRQQFSFQSERQQRVSLELFKTDGYIQAMKISNASVTKHYANLMLRKGLVFRRQQLLRLSRDLPELKPLIQELEKVQTQLSQAAFKIPVSETEHAKLQSDMQQLTEQKERLEASLARASKDYASMQKITTIPEIQKYIPPYGVLIDCFEYHHVAFAGDHNIHPTGRRLVAFVVPTVGDVQIVDLGSVDNLQKQLDSWTQKGPLDKNRFYNLQFHGHRMYQQLWAPLVKHLPTTEAGKVPLVMISPDGILNQVPWHALFNQQPSNVLSKKESEKYLIEQAAITYVPIPQLIPQLLNSAAQTTSQPSLLAVGDVDYGTIDRKKFIEQLKSSTSEIRRMMLNRPVFLPIQATKDELSAVTSSYRLAFDNAGMKSLSKTEATKIAFKLNAPQNKVLHLATHGFFGGDSIQNLVDSKSEQVLVGNEDQVSFKHNPYLLTGIAFANANSPQSDDDDGILTAEEVLGLDLRKVELTTLSACETGLGSLAQGEGILSLQRAFHVAGCRSVIASQWAIHDLATRDLMGRFYNNLWNKKMPKLAALREAQLWMLRERGPKGLMYFNEQRKAIEELDSSYQQLPSYFWAGFMLSGDWQ